jgi:hypothetical protein
MKNRIARTSIVRSRLATLVAALLSVAVASSTAAELSPSNLDRALAKVRSVGAEGQGHADAAAAAKELRSADARQLPKILAAMDGAGEIASNWLRGVAESVAQKSVDAGEKLPADSLEAFLADTKHSPRGRRLAYEMLVSVDPGAEERWIPKLLNDPSLELRRDAVAAELERAGKLKDDKPAAIAAYQKAFHAARELDQIKEAAAKLKELEEPVDTARHMGFITTWKLIGPFDNVGDIGWDIAYPPEKQVDFAGKYAGQKGEVKWFEHTTADDYGLVDLTKALDKHKGAVAYAAAEFIADEAQTVDFRLGSINAVKLWVNGKQLDERHVYHAGNSVDQYVSRGELKKGKNIILVKICQNEQTEAWAQDWNFQLRVCNEIGTAVLSQDRATSKTALR